MKRLMYVSLGLVFLFLMSCKQNSVNGDDPQSEWEKENSAEIQTVLEADSDLNFDAIDDGSEDNIDQDDPNWTGSGTLAKTTKTKMHFGRIRKHPVERTVQIVFDTDSTATAYVNTVNKGIFVVHTVKADSDSITYKRFEKPMTHEVERVVHLMKVRDTEHPRLNWKIKDISMKSGHSPNNTVEIVELSIMPTAGDSVVITDPLNYFMDGTNMFVYPRLTDVHLQVKVKNTSSNPMIYPEGTQATETVRLIYGRNMQGNFARKYFTWIGQDELGNNIYEGTWTVRQFRGMHHAVIDVIDNGTILSPDNDLYPYNSSTWSTPYRVTLF